MPETIINGTRTPVTGSSPAGTEPRWRVVPSWPLSRRRTRRPRARRSLVTGLTALVLLTLYAVVVPLFDQTDTRVVDLAAYLTPPSFDHPFGTDLLGRDLFTRCAQGLRISLALAAAAALVSTVIGALVGTISAAVGGWVDTLCMRVVDAANALPHLLLGVVIAALWRGQWWAVVVSIGLTHWTQVARIVRSEVLHVRTSDHVAAAVVSGATRVQVWATHLLPAVVPQTLIAVVLLLPHAVWHESALSFLGVGLPPNDPSLGTLLEDARSGILAGGWWLLAFPGGFLTATCLAIAGIGGYVRDLAMPRRAVEAEVTR